MFKIICCTLLLPIVATANPRVCLTKPPQLDDSKLILSSDLTLYRNTQYTNPSIQYYASNYSIGVQTSNVRLGGTSVQSFENDTYLNASTKFNITSKYFLEFGGMVGTNLTDQVKQLHTFG